MVVSIIAIMATNAKVVFGQRLVVITIVAPRFFRRDIIVGLLVATADDNGTPENGFLFPAGRKGIICIVSSSADIVNMVHR